MIRASTFALVCVITASSAYAQPSLASQAREAFEAHDYARALRFLEQLHEQSPSPRVLFNEATCLSRLARHREAVAVLEELLAWPALEEIFEEAERAAVREALEASRARLVPVQLTGPPGTTARVDGELDCHLPCTLSLDEGDHAVESAGRVEHVMLTLGDDASLDLTPPETDPPPPPSPEARRFQPRALTWVGGALALLGAGGVVGFGLRSNALHDQFGAAGPRAPESLADEGRLMTGLANASIALLGVGLVLVLIDLLIEREVE